MLLGLLGLPKVVPISLLWSHHGAILAQATYFSEYCGRSQSVKLSVESHRRCLFGTLSLRVTRLVVEVSSLSPADERQYKLIHTDVAQD